jgi:uncharacterized phage-associated protein
MSLFRSSHWGRNRSGIRQAMLSRGSMDDVFLEDNRPFSRSIPMSILKMLKQIYYAVAWILAWINIHLAELI